MQPKFVKGQSGLKNQGVGKKPSLMTKGSKKYNKAAIHSAVKNVS